MRLFAFLVQKSRAIIILAVVAGLISGISSTGLIVLINRLIASTGPSPSVWIFFGLCLMVFLAKIVSQIVLINLTQNAFFELRMHLGRVILDFPLHHLEEIGAARLLATLTDDVAFITNAVVGLPYLLINAAVIVACLTYVAILSPWVFLATLGALAIGIIGYQLPIAKAQKFLKAAREDQDTIFSHYEGLIRGIKQLKLHNSRQQAFLNDNLHVTADYYRQHAIKGMTVYSIAGSWGQLLYFLLIGLLLLLFPNLIQTEQAVLTGYILVVLYMMSPIEVVMGWVPQIGRADVAFKKIESLGLLLSGENAETRGNASAAPFSDWQELKLHQVTHTYAAESEDHVFTLGPIDLCLHPGELLFLVGGNGSGKSTLAKVLVGLYPPEGGHIVLDDKEITVDDLMWYRQHFTAVFSDYFLFEKLLGLESPTLQSRAQELLRQLQLDTKVKVAHDAFSTTDLSGGQQKRLALLTAYLEDRPIYIFDEWAADQDPVFREIFYRQLLPELKQRQKCVVVITHDDHYFYVADRIIKLEYGRIVAA